MLGGGMSKVIHGLYVGGYRDSKDVQELDKHGITHIVAVHDTAKKILPVKHCPFIFNLSVFVSLFLSSVQLIVLQLLLCCGGNVTKKDRKYLCVSASDVPSQNLSQYFSSCSNFIHEARLTGGHVLIHCLAGMSRSVTVAVAYIMTVTSLNWQEALQAVRGVRPIANPNSGFQRQLEAFDSERLQEERRRIVESFGELGRVRAEQDEVCCRKLLITCLTALRNGTLCQGHCTPPSRCPTGICRAHSQLYRGRTRKMRSPLPKPRSVQLPRKSLSNFRPYTTENQGERRVSVWSVSSLPARRGSLSEICGDENESEELVCDEDRPGTAPGWNSVNNPFTDEADGVNECLSEECDALLVLPEAASQQPETQELEKKVEEQPTETSPKRSFIAGLNFRKLLPRNIFTSMPDLPDKSAPKSDAKPASELSNKLTLMKSPSSDCVLPLEPRRALPEITHAYEAEDGIDPLTSDDDLTSRSRHPCEEEDRRRAESFVRSRWSQISALSRSQINRLSRAFRASRLVQAPDEVAINDTNDNAALSHAELDKQVTVSFLAQEDSFGANT